MIVSGFYRSNTYIPWNSSDISITSFGVGNVRIVAMKVKSYDHFTPSHCIGVITLINMAIQ
jgi:hypothetical protein